MWIVVEYSTQYNKISHVRVFKDVAFTLFSADRMLYRLNCRLAACRA